jgi:ribulose-phosphate 3-epimerase
MSLVVPALLSPSRKELGEALALVADLPEVARIQIDVVDGRFASPATWPYTAPHELAGMRAAGAMLPMLHRIEYEIDLMCLDAAEAAGAWLTLGASRLVFHAESVPQVGAFLAAMQKRYAGGVRSCALAAFGIALNVESDLALIEPYLDRVEFVQFMGIARIGRQGQPFDPRVVERVRRFHAQYPDLPVQVDGGVSAETAPALVAAGVSNVVVGSAILRAADPRAVFARLEATQDPYGVSHASIEKI